MEISRREIFKTRVINDSVKNLWSRWTTHEGLLTFFGKDNFVELTIGGPFEIYFLMDNPYGLRGSEGCRILSFLPERMLSFSWNAPPQFKDIRDSEYKTWVVVLFTVEGDNMTWISLNHVGWPSDPRWDKVFDYFEKAWDQVLNQLEIKGGQS